MNDQSLPPPKEQHSRNLLSAVEVMTAILDSYSPDPNNPDASLAVYITGQLVIGSDAIPKPIWNLLSGLTTLTHLLLRRAVESSNGEFTEQTLLDLYGHAARQGIERATEPTESERE